MVAEQYTTFDRILHKAVRLGKYPGVRGRIGYFLGQHVGLPVKANVRITIENPHEYIQSLILQGKYEFQIVNLIEYLLHPNDSFFDVGANIGYFTLIAAAIGVEVHAFEPVPRLAGRLRADLRRNHLQDRVTVVEAALSNQVGRHPFHVARRQDDGSHSMIAGVEAQSVETIWIDTLTLDEYIARTGIRVPDLVKIDVEGAEALVLDGGNTTFGNEHPPVVIIETADRLADQLNESAASTLQRLFSRGYRIWRIRDYENQFVEILPGEVSGALANYLAVPKDSSRLNLFVDSFDISAKNFGAQRD